MLPFVLSLVVSAAPSPKASADLAYRQRRYEVACPLYEAVAAKQKFDPWAWNDLALCRLKSRAWSGALEALDLAGRIEKTVPDEKLAKAITFNLGLLQGGVLADASGWDAEQVAATLGRRALAAEDPKAARALLQRGRQVLGAEDLAGLAGLVADEGDGPRARALIREAEAKGADVGRLYFHLPEVPLGPPPALAHAPAWLANCWSLLGTEACGRQALLCTSTTNGDYGTSETVGVIIDAATLPRWTVDPTSVATPAAGLELARNTGDGRCPMHDADGNFASPPDNGTSALSLIAVDLCAGTLEVATEEHPQCGETTYGHAVRPLVFLAPPEADAGR